MPDTIAEFAAYHTSALERDECRNNVLLSILANVNPQNASNAQFWSLGGPGQCAFRNGSFPMVLGELDKTQCELLAALTVGDGYSGILGNDNIASWFATEAGVLGICFDDPIPQQIQVLDSRPLFPAVPGVARPTNADDSLLLADWIEAFHREAVPHDPVPPRGELEKKAATGRFVFWTIDGQPVSMATNHRNTRNAAVIGVVYTPPSLRGRGYAGAATAAVCDYSFARGKRSVCLYTDLRNPFSNRCYAKIGFKPLCQSFHYVRQDSRA